MSHNTFASWMTVIAIMRENKRAISRRLLISSHCELTSALTHELVCYVVKRGMQGVCLLLHEILLPCHPINFFLELKRHKSSS